MQWVRARSHELCSPPHQLDLRLEAEQLSQAPADERPRAGRPALVAGAAWRPVVLDVQTRAHREVLQVLREDPSLQVLDRYAEQRARARGASARRPPPRCSKMASGGSTSRGAGRSSACSPRGASPPSASTGTATSSPARSSPSSARCASASSGSAPGTRSPTCSRWRGWPASCGSPTSTRSSCRTSTGCPGRCSTSASTRRSPRRGASPRSTPTCASSSSPRASARTTSATFLDGLDLVIEECDSLDVKLLVREAARDRRIPVVMQTSDRGVLDVERFDLEPERPIFHGLLPGVHSSDLAGLSLEAKAPYVLRMMGAADVSSRGAASLLEVGRTITAWPQLASEVTLGGATAAAVVRRFGPEGPPAVRARPHRPRRRHRRARPRGPAPPTIGAATSDDPAVPGAARGRRRDRSDRRRRAARAVRRQHPALAVRGGRQPRSASTSSPSARPRWTCGSERATSGIGAALFNARVAAAAERRLGTVKLFPEGYPSRHVATLRLGDASDFEVAPLQSRIQHACGEPQARRARPDRGVHGPAPHEGRRARGRPAPPPHRAGPDRPGGASSLAESDRIRFLTPTLHREMMGELRIPGRDTVDEGIDVRTLELGPGELAALELLRRPEVMAHLAEWRGGQMLGMRSRVGVSMSSAMAAIVDPARRSHLLRARRRGRRALLADRGGPRPRGAPGVAGVPVRCRRRGASRTRRRAQR